MNDQLCQNIDVSDSANDSDLESDHNGSIELEAESEGPFLWTDDGDLEVDSKVKVLKKDDYQTLLSAKAMLAKLAEEQIIAQESALKIYKEQKQKGFEEGVMLGKKSLIKEAVAESQRHAEFTRNAEKQLVEVVQAVVHKLIAEIPDQELLVKLGRSALEQCIRSNQMVLRVAPQQVSSVKDSVAGFLAEFPDISQIDVRGDKSLGLRDCVLETFSGLIIDASIDVQLRGLREVLFGDDQSGEGQGSLLDSSELVLEEDSHHES